MRVPPRGVWVARILLTGALAAACGTLAFAQKPAQKGEQKPDPALMARQQAQQQEIQTVVRMADAAMTGQPAPSDFPLKFENDFLKAQGNRVWVPVTLTLDPAKMTSSAVTLYFRVTPRGMTAPPPPIDAKDDKDKGKDKGKKKDGAPAAPAAPAYPYEDVAFLDLQPAAPGEPIRIQRGIGVLPGSYDMYVVVHERPAAGPVPAAAPASAGKTSILKQPLDVPDYGSGNFTTSSVILADRVDPLPAPIASDQQSERPYAFGQTEIVVSPNHTFRKSQELIVLFQIYNPALSQDKKFNLEATYTFYALQSGAEKKFNSTEPQPLTPDKMGAAFDPAGSSIQAGQGIPLQSFPAGPYRLEITITDKLNNKTLTRSANFTVAP